MSTKPGHSTLTCTPWLAASARSAVDRPTTACLVVVYGSIAGAGMSPASDAVLRMWPLCCARKCGYAAVTPLMTPRRFTSSALSQWRSSSSSRRPPIADPGVVDHDVEPAVLGDDAVDEGSHCRASATSTVAATAEAPSSRAVCSADAVSRSATTTRLPRRTSSAAMALPMPEPAPVTIDT